MMETAQLVSEPILASSSNPHYTPLHRTDHRPARPPRAGGAAPSALYGKHCAKHRTRLSVCVEASSSPIPWSTAASSLAGEVVAAAVRRGLRQYAAQCQLTIIVTPCVVMGLGYSDPRQLSGPPGPPSVPSDTSPAGQSPGGTCGAPVTCWPASPGLKAGASICQQRVWVLAQLMLQDPRHLVTPSPLTSLGEQQLQAMPSPFLNLLPAQQQQQQLLGWAVVGAQACLPVTSPPSTFATAASANSTSAPALYPATSPPGHLRQLGQPGSQCPPPPVPPTRQDQVRSVLAAGSQPAVQTSASTHQLAQLACTYTPAPKACHQTPSTAAPSLCQLQQLPAPAGAVLEPQAKTQDLVPTAWAQLSSKAVVTPKCAAQDLNPGLAASLPPAMSAPGRSSTCSLLPPGSGVCAGMAACVPGGAITPAPCSRQPQAPGDAAPAGPCGLRHLAALSTPDPSLSCNPLPAPLAPADHPAVTSTGCPLQGTGMQSAPSLGPSPPSCHHGLCVMVTQDKVPNARVAAAEVEVAVEVVVGRLPLLGTRAAEQGAPCTVKPQSPGALRLSSLSFVEEEETSQWVREGVLRTKEGGETAEEGEGQGAECGPPAAALDTSQIYPPGACLGTFQAYSTASPSLSQQHGPPPPGGRSGSSSSGSSSGSRSSGSRHVPQAQPGTAPAANDLLQSCLAAALVEVGWQLSRLQCL